MVTPHVVSDADVFDMLNATLHPPSSPLKPPEVALSEAELLPGFIPALFRLATNPVASQSSISLVAAIYLKNLVRREWHHPHTAHTAPALAEKDKVFLRAAIIPGMPHADPKVRAQLAEALKRMISADFPARFPALLPLVQEALHGDDPRVVGAGLVVLRALAKVYEFKGATLASRAQGESEERLAGGPVAPAPGTSAPPDWDYLHRHPRVAFNFIVRETFPRLLDIMNGLNAVADVDEERHRSRSSSDRALNSATLEQAALLGDKVYEMQRTICKIFWSFTQYDLPEYLVYDLPGAFTNWMSAFLSAIRRPVPPLPASAQLHSEDQLRRQPQWKVKQWAGHIVYRLFQRYSNPSCLSPSVTRQFDLQTLTAFGDYFRRTFAAPFTSAMLDILTWDQRHTSPRVANLALLYLESAVSTSITYRVVKPRLGELITNVIFPYLCISEADLALWVDDPVEYVRKAYDVLEDFNTPRAAACSLLLVLSKLRNSAVVSPTLRFLEQILDAYATEKQRHGQSARAKDETSRAALQRLQALARQKDGALLAIGTIRNTFVSSSQNMQYLEAILDLHVTEEFHSDVPFLRARACWLYGQLIASESVSTAAVLNGLAGVQKCLSDKEFPVRVRAAVDIRHFLHNKAAAEQIAPSLSELLTLLFTLLDDIDNTDIVATIDQVVVGFSDEIAPLAAPLCARLVGTFARAAAAGHGDDEAGFAAAQCIQALQSIVTSIALSSVPNKIYILAEIEQMMSEVFSHMFEEDRIEYFEDALELLAMFVYHSAAERGAHVRACLSARVEPDQALLGLPGASGISAGMDVMQKDPVLRQAMQSDANNGGGVVTPYLWSLLPQAMHAFHEWAYDYSFHYLHLVDSYLSKSPRVFTLNKSSESSNVQLLLGMISRLWDESSLEEDDFAVQGSRVCGLLLQHCHNLDGECMEREVGVLTQLVVIRLRASTESVRAVSSLLRSLAHLTYVSPVTTLTVIEKVLGYTEDVFTLWVTMIQEGKLETTYDKKCSAIALTSILKSDWALLPDNLRQAIPQLLLTIVKLLDSLANHASPQLKDESVHEGDTHGEGRADRGEVGSRVVLSAAPLEKDSNISGRSDEVAGEGSFGMRARYTETGEGSGMDLGREAEEENCANVHQFEDEEKEGASVPEALDGENPMFCILSDVDELLYFDNVVRRLPVVASQQLMTTLALEEAQRIECTLHRAAELRTFMVNGTAKA